MTKLISKWKYYDVEYHVRNDRFKMNYVQRVKARTESEAKKKITSYDSTFVVDRIQFLY